MRRRPLLLLLASLGLVLMMAGCSKPISPLDASSAVQLASVSQAGDQMLVGMMDPSQSLTPAGLATMALGTTALSTQVATACSNPTYTNSGWGTDSDNDGIPDNASTIYSCASANTSMSGTLTVTDKAGADSGYTVTVQNFKITVTSGGQQYSVTFDTTFDLTVQPGGGTYDLVYSFDLGVDTPSGTGAVHVSGTPTYTPVDPGNPYVAGTFTLNGQATFDGLGGKFYQITRTSNGLSFDKTGTCTTGFNAGSVVYQDSQGHTATLSYTGCNTGTIDFGSSQVGSF